MHHSPSQQRKYSSRGGGSVRPPRPAARCMRKGAWLHAAMHRFIQVAYYFTYRYSILRSSRRPPRRARVRAASLARARAHARDRFEVAQREAARERPRSFLARSRTLDRERSQRGAAHPWAVGCARFKGRDRASGSASEFRTFPTEMGKGGESIEELREQRDWVGCVTSPCPLSHAAASCIQEVAVRPPCPC